MTDEQIQQIHDDIRAQLSENAKLLFAISQFLSATTMIEA